MSNSINKKATEINLFSFKTPKMRAFHLSWFVFFLCFFGWFSIAPLMAGILFKAEKITHSQAFFILGLVVTTFSILSLIIKFSTAEEEAARTESNITLSEKLVLEPVNVKS